MGDTLFGLTSRNSGQYFSADAKTGKTLWSSEPRQAGNAAIVKAGNLAFSLEDDGELVVFRSAPAGFEMVKKYTRRRVRNVDAADARRGIGFS